MRSEPVVAHTMPGPAADETAGLGGVALVSVAAGLVVATLLAAQGSAVLSLASRATPTVDRLHASVLADGG